MSRKKLQAALTVDREINNGDVASQCDQSGPSFSALHEIASLPFNEVHDGVFSVRYAPDNRHLAVGYGDGGIELLSLGRKGPSLKCELRKHSYGGLPVTAIRFKTSEPDVCFAGACEGQVYMCDTEKATCQSVIVEKGNEVNCLDVSHSSGRLATAGKDLAVRLYDTETFQLINTYQGYNYSSVEQSHSTHAQRIFALCYFPEEEHLIVTGGWDNHLKIWDSRTADGVIGTIPGPHICGDSLDIKGRLLVTGSWVASEAVQLWDLATFSLVQTLPLTQTGSGSGEDRGGEFVYCCRLCDGGVVLVGGSGTNSAQAYRLDDNRFLGEIQLQKPVQALDITDGGRHFVFGGVASVLKFGILE